MGLDMYLTAHIFVAGSDFVPAAEKTTYAAVVKACGISPTPDCPHLTIKIPVVYWRKANAIHRWFVDHCQDGNDDCHEAYVSREQLATLRDLCQQVADTVETVEGDVKTGKTYRNGKVTQHTKKGRVICQTGLAEQLLPTQEGFFFGGAEYDEFYLGDVEETVEKLNRILDDGSLQNCDFYYQSSW